MALERLDGLRTSRGPLRVANVRPGRFPEERDAELLVEGSDGPIAFVKHFAGRPSAHVRPWIEVLLRGADERLASELLVALAGLLAPGSHLMVGYGGDETEQGLKRRFPPVTTPIGKALYDAGCTWFKDWYYPEGWLEGGFKLQGNLPSSPEAAGVQREALRAELEQWLLEAPDDELGLRARERARAVLARS